MSDCPDFKPTSEIPDLCWWWAIDEDDKGYCSRPDWDERECATQGRRAALEEPEG